MSSLVDWTGATTVDWPEHRHSARFKLHATGCSVDFQVFPHANLEEPYEFEKAGEESGRTKMMSNGAPLVSGYVKWDGCSNLWFDCQETQGMLHFCDKSEVVVVGTLMGLVYDEAHALLPSPDWD